MSNARELSKYFSDGIQSVDTITDLQEFNYLVHDKVVFVRGYHEVGDGGGGHFRWDADATENHDGGMFISSLNSITGKWKRVDHGTTFDIRWWGAKAGIYSGNSAAFNAALDYCQVTNDDGVDSAEVYIPSDYYNTYVFDEPIYMRGTCRIRGDSMFASRIRLNGGWVVNPDWNPETNDVNKCNGFVIQDLYVTGEANVLLRVQKSDVWTLRRVLFDKSEQTALWLEAVQDVIIEDVQLLNNAWIDGGVHGPKVDEDFPIVMVKDSNNVYFVRVRHEEFGSVPYRIDSSTTVTFDGGKTECNGYNTSWPYFRISGNSAVFFNNHRIHGSAHSIFYMTDLPQVTWNGGMISNCNANAVFVADNLEYVAWNTENEWSSGASTAPKAPMIFMSRARIVTKSYAHTDYKIKSLLNAKAPENYTQVSSVSLSSISRSYSAGGVPFNGAMQALSSPPCSFNMEWLGSWLVNKRTGARNQITYCVTDGLLRAENGDGVGVDWTASGSYRIDYASRPGLRFEVSDLDIISSPTTGQSGSFDVVETLATVTVSDSVFNASTYRTEVTVSETLTANEYAGRYLLVNGSYHFIIDNSASVIYLDHEVEVPTAKHRITAGYCSSPSYSNGHITVTTRNGHLAWTDGARARYPERAAMIPSLPGSVSLTWNPGTISANTSVSTTTTLNGAAFGDAVLVGVPYALGAGVTASASVSNTNTIRLTLHNGSGSGVTLGSGTWKLYLIR